MTTNGVNGSGYSAADVMAASNGEQKKTDEKDPLAQKDVFLQLLVAQIRNQDPLNPADGTEFLTQLAQFSQLEQIVQIGSDLGSIREALAPSQGESAGAPAQTNA